MTEDATTLQTEDVFNEIDFCFSYLVNRFYLSVLQLFLISETLLHYLIFYDILYHNISILLLISHIILIT